MKTTGTHTHTDTHKTRDKNYHLREFRSSKGIHLTVLMGLDRRGRQRPPQPLDSGGTNCPLERPVTAITPLLDPFRPQASCQSSAHADTRSHTDTETGPRPHKRQGLRMTSSKVDHRASPSGQHADAQLETPQNGRQSRPLGLVYYMVLRKAAFRNGRESPREEDISAYTGPPLKETLVACPFKPELPVRWKL